MMYVHIGNDVVVHDQDIIGIFDMDTSTVKKITMKYLQKIESEGKLINISDDLPKSFIICKKSDKEIVYLSNLNSSTLIKRHHKTIGGK